MKKRIQISVICAVLAVLGVLLAVLVKNSAPVLAPEPPTTTAAPTSAPTTAAPTAPPTTAEQSTSALIDLNSLTVIDLLPLSLAGGGWDVKHCQGITTDSKNGYIYYSYTTLLVKCDWDGNIVGTVTGFEGHLGDIAFNEDDGKIYCGYYAPKRRGIYIVVFDGNKITRENISAKNSDVVRTVHLEEAFRDYRTDMNGDGKIEGGVLSPDHRFGCSGIDGVTFGPSFKDPKKKKNMLTVAYGTFPNPQRKDNHYQVLLQYDVSDWWNKYAKPFSVEKYHRSGPEKTDGKFFVYTGHTNYGVQTMEYFDEMNLWLLNCYAGQNEKFNKYTLFAVDGDVAPEKKNLRGQPEKTKGLVLSLYQDGDYDAKHDIYGWYCDFGVQGITYINNGLFYIVRPYKSWYGTKTAICYLNVWNPSKKSPFSLAAGIGNDYKISKKPRIETTAPSSAPKTEPSSRPEASGT